MNAIVLYYSRDGSTKIVAEYLAKRHHFDIFRLQEEKPRRGFLLSAYRAVKGKRIKLAGEPWNLCKDKDAVVLGAPIWAGNANPALNSFLDQADLKGKKIFIFTVQADPNLEGSQKVLDHFKDCAAACGGEVVDVKGFRGGAPGKTSSAEHLLAQVDDWNLNIA